MPNGSFFSYAVYMSLTHQIAKNTAWQISGKIIAIVLGIFTIGLMTRYLGLDGYGQYATVWAYLQFFGLVTDFGLQLVVSREISKADANEEHIIGNAFGLRLALNIVFLLIAPLIALLFPYPPLVKIAILVATLFFFFQSTTNLFMGSFQKRFAMGMFTIIELIPRALLLVLIALTPFFGQKLLWVTFAFGITAGCHTILVLFRIKNYYRLRILTDWPMWKYLFLESWPLALSIGLILVYFKGDTLLLSLYYPDTVVGLYGAPYKILEVLATVPAAFAGLLLPILSRHWSEQRIEDYGRVLQRGMDFLFLLGLPMVVGMYFISTDVMRIVAGPDFIQSGPLLTVLMIATAVIFLSNILQFAIIAAGEQRKLTKFFAMAAVLALGAYLITIPRYSYWGAAWTTVGVELLVMALYLWLLKRMCGWKWKLGLAGKVVLSCLVMAFSMFVLRTIPWYLLAVIGTVVYGIVLFVTKAIDKEIVLKMLGRVEES
ncbi:MAG: flippase [bacterium]